MIHFNAETNVSMKYVLVSTVYYYTFKRYSHFSTSGVSKSVLGSDRKDEKTENKKINKHDILGYFQNIQTSHNVMNK